MFFMPPIIFLTIIGIILLIIGYFLPPIIFDFDISNEKKIILYIGGFFIVINFIITLINLRKSAPRKRTFRKY